jgi:hypothetical protein
METSFWAMLFLWVTIGSTMMAKDEDYSKPETVIKYLMLDTDVKGRPPVSEQIKNYLEANKIPIEEIEKVLIGFVKNMDKTENDYVAKRLAKGGLYLLGELRCKNSLSFLHETLHNSTDERFKYECAVAILKIENDPVPFIDELLSGNILPPNFNIYMGSLFEKIHNIRLLDPLLHRIMCK